ncbi:MAG: hypothetical protein WC087_01155 [Candidatus Paceibacterota bacterium]
MKKFTFKKIDNKEKGFALLFAVLVSVMVLAVGASIINIALKQVILSGAGRESQFAFYAANTGMECALYWDLNGTIVDPNTGVAQYVFPPGGEEGLRRTDTNAFECSGTNIATGVSVYEQSYTQGGWDTAESSTVFRIAISNNGDNTRNILSCAEVTVEKTVATEGEENESYTIITSQGLNTCDPEGDERAVQRGLVLQYRS